MLRAGSVRRETGFSMGASQQLVAKMGQCRHCTVPLVGVSLAAQNAMCRAV